MSIIVQNLSKTYGAQKAVNNISFKINKGEIVGFLGPNGAGKSTTMKMITGYLEADGGSAEVSGEKVSTGSLSTKKKIGYLPEANPLYFDMYVREYLEFISNIHEIKNQQQAIERAIATTGLTLEANKKIGQLSKGYKQRVGLAAALIHDPEVLILDEPTSGLDPNQIVEIREVIKSLGQNKTVLFSSHILQEVQAICDRVIIINRGNIVADDKLSNLQKGEGDQSVVIVAFKEIVATETLTALTFITAVELLDAHPEGGDDAAGSRYKLLTANPGAVKKQLLELSFKNNLNIVSLQSESNSLEDIFRTLTATTIQNNFNQ
jgi:ABC-2 type transport system ATP-binding protein